MLFFTIDLLTRWRSLLGWSESNSTIRNLQDEIDVLMTSLQRIGVEVYDFDSKETVAQAIVEVKNERTKLQFYRSKMLNINASVQRWISNHETKPSTMNMNESTILFHEQLKDKVSEMYDLWNQTETRLNTQLDTLEASLSTWQQFERGFNELKETLEKDKGAILGFKGALESGSAIPNEFVSDAETVARLLRDNSNLELKVN